MQELVKIFPDPSSSTISVMSFPLTQIVQQIQQIQLGKLLEFMREEARLQMARKLMDSYKPTIIKLKPGSIKKVDENMIIEKTTDGKIILYEVSS
jgi:hypothetical protein